MNNLVNMTAELTMSSAEIAELCGKRHDNVKRTIESLSERGVIQLPQIEVSEKINGLGLPQKTCHYQLCKRDSYVVVAQLSPEFTARLVDRWQELEEERKLTLPKTFSEALRLAADTQEKLEAEQAKLLIAAPKADVYDRIVERAGLYNATQIAQKFGQSAIWLNKQLTEMNVYNRSVKRGKAFQQWFIDAGYGIMRETENGFSQPMFYAEGEMWIVRKLSEESLI